MPVFFINMNWRYILEVAVQNILILAVGHLKLLIALIVLGIIPQILVNL